MSKLRLIQCGVGGFGKGWLENHTTQSEDFDLAAIVDLSAENLEAGIAIANLPKDKAFSTLEEALDVVEADAVLTVTPPAVHAIHARLAFAKGLHVMTEKPLADTIPNGKEMIALAKAAGKQLAVSQNYRFNATIQKIKSMIAEKELGELGHAHMDFYIPADFTGTFRETMEYPLLLDMSIHHFDLIRCITGRDIEKIIAWSFRPEWSWYQHEPGLKMMLELEGGIPFSYSGDWSARGRGTSWNGDWRLQCSEGAILFEHDEIFIARSERWGGNQTVEPVVAPGIERTAQAATLHLFAQAIRSGELNEISGENNMASFASVEAGIQSAKQGRVISVKEIIG